MDERPQDRNTSAAAARRLAGLDPAAVRLCLERILASRTFAASERMCRFLRFAVERALAGQGSELKEYLLGVEIFDRDDSFDPRIDPIVRVEARRLRAKLKSYYEGDGSADAILIELPTGAYVPRFRTRAAVVATDPAPEAPEAEPGTIAVLPFKNLSSDADNEYFSDGLTEELIHALTKLEGLRVVAWNSAAQLKDQQDDVAGIGRQLNVATVLMGSVRSSGDRLRVMARLVETASGVYLWSETYDREAADLFAIQEEISRAIVDTLRIRLIGARASGGAIARTPSNLEVYNLYLKARFHWNKRTREGLERSKRYFQETVAIDPGFAPGWAGLADAYTLTADYGLERPADVMGAARSAALKALELDPALADAHASLALILSKYEWRWAEAGEHYRRAIELSPGYVTARHWYACDYLSLLGRAQEAIEQAEIAVQLDPLSAIIAESLAYVLLLAGRHEDSLEQARKIAELSPFFYKAYTCPGRTCIQLGDYAKAIELLERGRALAGDLPGILGALGQAHAMVGNRPAARAFLARLHEIARTTHVAANSFAIIHIGLREKEQALDWLEKGAARREPSMAGLKAHPVYDCLREEPRFAALLKQIGFSE